MVDLKSVVLVTHEHTRSARARESRALRMLSRSFAMSLAFAVAASAWADGGQGAASPTEAEGLVEETGRNPWHFRVGPVMAPRVRTKLSTPRLTLPQLPRNGSMATGTYGNAPAGPEAGYVRRDYVNGRIYPDEGTADPGSMIEGLTWDWGADDVAAQYNGGRVDFQTGAGRWTESYSTASSGRESDSERDRDTLLGLEAMGGWTFWDNSTFDATIDFGFRFYGSDDAEADSRRGASVRTTRNEYRYVDSYDASGWSTVPSGSYDGTAGGPGRLLGALPDRREEQTGSYQSYSSYSSYSSTTLDYRIWDLRLGPTFGWHATDWFQLRGGIYGLLGLVDAELETDVGGASGAYHADSSKCTPLFGMAFSLMAQANLTDRFFLYGAIEYDWWTDKVAMDAGGSHAVLEMSDYSVSAGLGFEF